MNIKACIAEFVSTFALVFVGVGAIASDFISGGQSDLLGIAFAHGLTIAVMVAATAAISGGHVNPAVTVGFWATKKIDLNTAVSYIIFQCLGAISAAALLKVCFPGIVLNAINMGTPSLASNVTAASGFIIEVVLTFFLMFVIFATAVDPRGPVGAPLYIGLTITLDILIGGPVTGAAMNPARFLGPALLGGGLSEAWLYWIGPITGAVCAAMVYEHLLLKKE